MNRWGLPVVVFTIGIMLGGLLPGQYRFSEKEVLSYQLDNESLNSLSIGMAGYSWNPSMEPGQATLLWYNQAARETVGPRYEGAYGTPIIELFPPLADEEGEKLLSLYKLAAEEKIFIDVGVSTYGDQDMGGRVFWNAVIPSETGFVAVFVDLSPAPDAFGWQWREGEYEKAFIDGIRRMGKQLEERLSRHHDNF